MPLYLDTSVGPTPAQMDEFCDLHGTLDTPVSRIVTVKPKNEKKMQFSLLLYFLLIQAPARMQILKCVSY